MIRDLVLDFLSLCLRHESGDIEWAAGYMDLELKSVVGNGDVNFS